MNQFPLISVYQQLSKKEKTAFLEKMLSNNQFTKSKEWLRKYLSGAYKRQEAAIEEIAWQYLTFPQPIKDEKVSAMIQPQPLKVIEQIMPQLNIKTTLSPIFDSSFDEFIQIIDKGFASSSLSEVGVNWFQFGRLCRKNPLQKSNPFAKITDLLLSKSPLYSCLQEELQQLYYQHIATKQETQYYMAWDSFGLKARFVYSINPFHAIHSIIHQYPNPQMYANSTR